MLRSCRPRQTSIPSRPPLGPLSSVQQIRPAKSCRRRRARCQRPAAARSKVRTPTAAPRRLPRRLRSDPAKGQPPHRKSAIEMASKHHRPIVKAIALGSSCSRDSDSGDSDSRDRLAASRTTGRPASTQAWYPPCMLTTSNPARCRMLAAIAERPPPRHWATTGLSSRRLSMFRNSVPRNRCSAPAMCPALNSVAARTSTSVISPSSMPGRSSTGVADRYDSVRRPADLTAPASKKPPTLSIPIERRLRRLGGQRYPRRRSERPAGCSPRRTRPTARDSTRAR